jgi:hypothetical protein
MASSMTKVRWHALGSVERGWWRLLRRTYGAEPARAGSLELATIDVRPSSERLEYDFPSVTSRALQRVSEARGGFGELVTSHLRVVAAMPGKTDSSVHPNVGAYVCAFIGPERTNHHYWAAHLVWAATVVRLARDAMMTGAVYRVPRIRQAAWDAQVRFLRQFEDSDRWIQSLETQFGVGASPP